jgi:hypothetical protein
MGPVRPLSRPVAAVLLAVLCLSAGYASAQFLRGGGGSARMAPLEMPDRDFAVCRIMFDTVRGGYWAGGGWRTDIQGEMNLSIRFSELTKTRVSMGRDRRPNTWVVRLTDAALFNCPYTVASDVGTMGLNDIEAERLRLYLLKGGFLWVDDFWGPDAWDFWVDEISRVLPPSEYPIADVPETDAIFSSQYTMKALPQIPRMPFWVSTGRTSELGQESAETHFRAIRDKAGRIMVMMTHNNDIADSWEREGENPAYFAAFGPSGYALGVNVLLYAMTH